MLTKDVGSRQSSKLSSVKRWPIWSFVPFPPRSGTVTKPRACRGSIDSRCPNIPSYGKSSVGVGSRFRGTGHNLISNPRDRKALPFGLMSMHCSISLSVAWMVIINITSGSGAPVTVRYLGGEPEVVPDTNREHQQAPGYLPAQNSQSGRPGFWSASSGRARRSAAPRAL